MGKTKKRCISDVKLGKVAKKQQNPFEVHINREKFKVLGKKSKFDRGLPGVARAKAIKKRKETLLQEYKVQDKANRFLDKRIGERNRAMTAEDKIIARFTAERMKVHRKKALFNLAEDEVLTHKGRSITEVERYDDPRSDDDEEDAQTGALDAAFVEEAHFGGGTLSKSKNNRESVIDQLIAESKKRKLEQQQSRERTLELTEKLDTEWRDLIPILSSNQRGDEDEPVANKGRGDPFDIALRELKFEARGKPSDKLKSEEEIAEQEAKRLKELEEERLRRMRGEDSQITVAKREHRSADALEDDFKIDDNDEFSVTYDKEGNLILAEGATGNDDNDDELDEATTTKSTTEVDEDISNDEDNDDNDDDDEEDDEDDIEDLKTEIEACNDDESGESADEKEQEMKSGESPTVRDSLEQEEGMNTSVDKDECHVEKRKRQSSLSDNEAKQSGDLDVPLKEMNAVETNENSKPHAASDKPAESEDATESAKKKKKVCFVDKVEEVSFGENAVSISKSRTTDEIRTDLMKRKELMDKARNELPYTFDVAKSYEEVEELFKGRTEDEIVVIVERMVKCNHPKLREENKQKMNNLFAFLMQYLNDLEHQNCWSMLDRLVGLLYDVAMFSPSNAAECLIEILKEKQSEYSEKKHKYPSPGTLLFLKLVPLLFPASDKRHPVTTPSTVFICQMLGNCKVTSRRSIAAGLFLVTLMYEYVSLSKRICPEALNFLRGLLHLATPVHVKSCVVPPFKPQHRFLYLQQSFPNKEKTDLKLSSSELSSTKSSKIDDDFRINSVYTTLNLLNLYVDLYEAHHASYLLFQSFKSYLDSFEVDKYPVIFNGLVSDIKVKLSRLSVQELEKVMVAAKKPKALRLYEPVIEPVYDTKKKFGESAEKAERNKLLHKIKREKKGALREIRRDKAFIAKIKYKQQQRSDEERMKKVKQIYSWGAEQQGEMNALERAKNKKKY